MYEDRRSIQHHQVARYLISQQDDLIHLGQILVALACGSQTAILDLPRALEHIQKSYSPDFKDLVLYLLLKPSPLKSIDQVIVNIAPRFVTELNSAFM